MGVETMVRTEKVSVAMVSYNGEKYIKEQLDSIFPQLEAQDEVIISDDGSDDKTLKILEEYQKCEERLRVVSGPGNGVKKNVENALKHCQGDIIFLADQDDIWKPNKVERVLQVMEEQQSMLVVHDAEVFHENLKEISMESFLTFRNAKAGVWKNIWKNGYIGCCMAFRKEVLEKVIPIPNTIEMHDQWIGILSDFYFGKSTFLKEPLLSYRRHGENSSSMQHYKIPRMIRNRFVFLWRFFGRILHIC